MHSHQPLLGLNKQTKILWNFLSFIVLCGGAVFLCVFFVFKVTCNCEHFNLFFLSIFFSFIFGLTLGYHRSC